MKTPILTADQRRQAVALVVSLTANTHLTPLRYERQLLARYELGELTLEQMSEAMDTAIYQLLYHSQAALPMQETDLQAILDWSQSYNEQHGITGVLLYSDRRFVQLLEGNKEAVQQLFGQIQQDTRHTHVTTIIEGPGPRLYPEWSMAFGNVESTELEQTLAAVQVEAPSRSPFVADPHLQKLLHLYI